MGYFKKTLQGLSWSLGLRFIIRGFAVIRTIILARILLPEQFGAYGVATVTLAFLEMFTETGINVFLIQEKELSKYLDTAWVASILRGLIIGAIIVISAPFIASFFRSPQSLQLLQLISLVAVIRGLVNPAEVKFQKDLLFHKEFMFRGVVLFIEAAIAISLALILRSPLSLALSLIISAICEVIISLTFIHPLPRFKFTLDKFAQILRQGKWVTAAGIFNYLYHNADNIVIGRLLGVSSLGLYDISYKISSLPITEISEVFGRVTFPVYTQISSDTSRLRAAFIKVMISITAITLPLSMILFFFPTQIISLFLGPNWLSAAPVLRLLSIYGFIRGISGSTSALFLSIGKNQYVTLVTLVSVLGLAVSIVPLVLKFGLSGAAISVIIGSVAALPVMAYFVRKTFV
ncbi:hypothetical protein A3D85_01590 [Candidatus Amesbacteria bacterium RIFCSPHIGHO2_02_FULL_47_9]|nr:MAG: hypothetical protein A3D85_01590 [Candidatus Amesbacteria bacterium RIFCSPHIGHO2_02_FULL_47_9]